MSPRLHDRGASHTNSKLPTATKTSVGSNICTVLVLCMLLAPSLFGLSCISTHGERSTDINPAGWAIGETARVTYINSDTLSSRDIEIILRADQRMAGKPLALEIRMTAPDSTYATTAMSSIIASRPKLRNGFFEVKLSLIRGARLEQSGEYIFSLTNKGPEIKGIHAIGFDFGKTQH